MNPLKSKISAALRRKAKLALSEPYFLTAPFFLISSPFRALPNFIILGAAKAGTTSLFAYIRRHPQVRLSYVKEVHYFDKNYRKGVLWYRSHFPLMRQLNNGDITGEASPYYLLHPHAPARISRLIPTVKMIVLLRNPVDRALSHYHHNVRIGSETLPVMEAMQSEEDRIGPEWDRMLKNESYYSRIHRSFSYKRRGVYIEQLERYLQYFAKDQIFVVNSDELFRDPQKVLPRLYGFLGVDPRFSADDTHAKNVNPYVKEVPAEVYDYLRQYFFRHNQKLYEYLGEDFGWDL